MSKTYVAAGPKAVIEIFRRLAPGRVIEIYQDVAAKDQVEIAVSRPVLCVDQIDAGEFDRAPQSLVDLMIAVGDGLEIAGDDVARKPHQRTVSIDALGGGLERPGIDIRSEDFDVVVVDLRPVLHQPKCDRIRLFAGRARYRPDADRAPRRLESGDGTEHTGGHAAKLVVLTIEIGLVDRERIDQMFDFVIRVGAQQRKIRLERRRAGRGDAILDTVIDEISLALRKRHAGAAVEKFAKTLDVIRRDRHGSRS